MVAIATNWLLEDSDPGADTEDLTRNDPDLFMSHATIKQFSEDGKAQRQLSADKFTHFPLTDLTTLLKPELVLFTDAGRPWRITSDHGRLLTRSTFREEVVELWDGVRSIKQSPDGQFVTIQTQSLTVYPEREYAETDKKVYIDDNTSQTTASGMKAHFAEGRFIFFTVPPGRVRTTYIPVPR